ncbi:hypothetical protein HDV57DRAFT_500136 [Trichoderma longibrachiatum]|uniref:Uncharacterized protein n=1 Tax=Trichoderma longibrachiatum ATCC 18648 TaxID=983965 RepID=A0A2T4BSE7_TRILO|nr:hypothetical protein M440DRAFT_1405932 [Trichoderma longibrachiatum ATCC 18648]
MREIWSIGHKHAQKPPCTLNQLRRVLTESTQIPRHTKLPYATRQPQVFLLAIRGFVVIEAVGRGTSSFAGLPRDEGVPATFYTPGICLLSFKVCPSNYIREPWGLKTQPNKVPGLATRVVSTVAQR